MTDPYQFEIDRGEKSLLDQRWFRLVLYIWFWSFLGVFHASQNYYIRLAVERPISWRNALLTGCADWYMWGAVAPLVYYLATRIPFERQTWTYALVLHLVVGMLVAMTIMLLVVPVFQFARETYEEPRPFMQILKFRLFGDFVFYLWIYWAIVGLSHAANYQRKFHDREMEAMHLENKLAKARLQVLKMQLQPHFLFNTLHAIGTLMHKNVDAAETMLMRLSDLLRLSLEHFGTQEVTVKQEFEFLEKYLDIQKSRFGDRLEVELSIEPVVMDARLPTFILQPMVENAVKHGVEKTKAKGRIEVRASGQGDWLRLEVCDNGPGLPREGWQKVREGIGLSNSRARLRHLYGSTYKLEMENVATGGLRVTLDIPYRFDAELEASSEGEHVPEDENAYRRRRAVSA